MRLVSICIATYQRLSGLSDLLASLEAQDLPVNLDIEILIVDNDPPSAQQLVAAHALRSRFTVHYLTQPEPNISLTRNVAVAAAQGELIWFIDDDEVAEPSCLRLLALALDEHHADVVYGPVVPSFEAPVPDWMRPLYERQIQATGTPSKAHRTGNTLVRTAALKLVDGPFDAAYGVSGGSDGLLFRQLENGGLRLIESADAVVKEVVPATRSTWKWLRSRTRRQGQNYGRQTVSLEGGVWTTGTGSMLLRAVVQVIMWSGAAAASWPNRTRRSQFLLRLWTNIGKIEGVAGAVSRRDP